MTSPESLLQAFVHQHRQVFVLTGAGLSAASGIPTYRDHKGVWQRSTPIQHQQFIKEHHYRQRYWARSLVGWQYVAAAKPNDAHQALKSFERSGRQSLLVTQNVDGLHQQAGSENICDLHGRIDQVICTDCQTTVPRSEVQTLLAADNPWLKGRVADVAPDGDADLEDDDIHRVKVPVCQHCGGLLKPDVVFFGDNVPRDRVATAMSALEQSDALWVIGSSLTVYSGFRFARRAAELGIPICLLNLGQTRADDLASLKIELDCGKALAGLTFPAA